MSESDLRDISQLLCEKRLLEEVLRLAREALLSRIQPPAAAAAAAAAAAKPTAAAKAKQQEEEEASKSAAAALQRLEQLAPQLLRHAAALRKRVAAQKTERLLGLMLVK